jgi:hypothetical protein
MDELRRFIRYTFPGMATMLAAFILFWLSGTVNDCTIMKYCKADAMGGLIVGAFIISSALGFILAQLYWGIYWAPILKNIFAKKHQQAIKDLVVSKKIKLVQINGKDFNIENLSIEKAWNSITGFFEQYYYEKMSKEVKVAGTLMDAAHGVGATILGFFLVFLVWEIYDKKISLLVSHCCIISCFAIIIVIMIIAYLRAHKAHKSVTEIIFCYLIDNIQKENKKYKKENTEDKEDNKNKNLNANEPIIIYCGN